MTGRLTGLLASWSTRDGLNEAREALGQSIESHREDRRFESRWPVPERNRMRISSVGEVVNLSETGFAVQVPGKCRFARGERHRLVLGVADGSIDVEGRVCWTRSLWNEEAPAKENAFRQLAGFEILNTMSSEAEHVMNIVRNMVRYEGVSVDVRDTEVTRPCSKPKRRWSLK